MKYLLYTLIVNGETVHGQLRLKEKSEQDGLKQIEYNLPISGYENCNLLITEQYDSKYSINVFHGDFINNSDTSLEISRLHLGGIAEGKASLNYFTSSWGNEFTPQTKTIEKPFNFGSNTGRSCGQHVPYAQLQTAINTTCFVLGWSGCWDCSVVPTENGCSVLMGISGENFSTLINKGESFRSADLYVSTGSTPELASIEMRRYFRRHVTVFDEEHFPTLPVEVNTWWVYEDRLINENIFYSNNLLAKEIGCTHSMLDAGWFGNETLDKPEEWFLKRGDWDNINSARFPSGMKALCDKAQDSGILPGIWCEIEAVGKNARLNLTHPHLIAKRDGESLGYLCFGSEEVRKWAMTVLDKIIGEYGAAWIKLDFNLDPAPGCNCENHGHGKNDGLYAHYKGYYGFLDDVRKKYPTVILENCASGGQRSDIEMLAHTHITFLSDPDFTAFHLQCYWGALSYLHQSVCFHFSWSDTTFGTHNCGVHRPVYEDMPRARFDFMIRAALMGAVGFSYDFAGFPEWAKERLKEHINFYNSISKAFIRNGDAYRLTAQPLKEGGERFPVFQFNAQSGEALVFGFRLDNSQDTQKVKLMELAEGKYEVSFFDSGVTYIATGTELCIIGLKFDGMEENSSEIVRIKPVYEK